MEKLKVFTTFSGYDSQCLALNRIGINYDLVGWSEVDKYAIKAHNALFPQYENRNYGDITKIDWQNVPDFDLFTYSSPCQDFSQAGKQRGAEKGIGTRSSLLWECEKAISIKRPKYCLMENVAAVVSQKFVKLFNEWQLKLIRLGYTNFAQVLNAKDYGIPQNRERIFLVSILDCKEAFYFPQKKKLNLRLKDMLEQDVPEKYYLKDSILQYYIENTDRQQKNGNGFKFSPTTGVGINEQIKTKVTGNLNLKGWHESITRVFDKNGISPTLCSGDAEKKIFENLRIRKLTPTECFRLMGLNDAESEKIISVVSDAQAYKMAGNSIVVNVLSNIFYRMLINTAPQENEQLQIF